MKIVWDEWLPAPAKINLFLHVVGRRADGYHELQTAFRFIGLYDRLRFSPASDGQVRLHSPLAGVPDDTNLVIRAARALQRAAGIATGATIEIGKTIPMGGGLGGGSSDAATTLLALDHLWQTHLGIDRLAELAVRLGADVPVFVRGRNAFAGGIGELLTPVDLPPRWYAILVPPVGVPTGEVFADPALTRDTERTTIAAFFAGGFPARNDLEPVVRRRYPEVGLALDWLACNTASASHAAAADRGEAQSLRTSRVPLAGPTESSMAGPLASPTERSSVRPLASNLVRMSGSGSCVFAEFQEASAAREVVARAARELPRYRGFAVPGLDRHPLAEGGVTRS